MSFYDRVRIEGEECCHDLNDNYSTSFVMLSLQNYINVNIMGRSLKLPGVESSC